MEDVIFAGTAGRPPLGRAEVTLTIDNTDGALPIDYTEVSITRRMFRDGASEYEINGTSCRLLDIQELLSDSGIGREMHVIVGQGQLDSVLQAKPEDRRGFIEEAAGVLKHRKRKEKALRKLDAMQANLTRLTDLTAELRRQLEAARPAGRGGPPGGDRAGRPARRPAAAARRRPGRRCAARSARRSRTRPRCASGAGRSSAELAAVQDREAELEAAIAADAPALARAQETWYRLSALEERFRGTAPPRRRAGAAPVGASEEDVRTGRDPEALEAEAAEIREQEEALREALEHDRGRLAEAVAERQELERSLAAAERALVAAVTRGGRPAGGAGPARRAGRGRCGPGSQPRPRRSTASPPRSAEARDRAAAAQAEFESLQAEVGGLDEGEVDLDERHESAVAALRRGRGAGRRAAGEAEREAERDRATGGPPRRRSRSA